MYTVCCNEDGLNKALHQKTSFHSSSIVILPYKQVVVCVGMCTQMSSIHIKHACIWNKEGLESHYYTFINEFFKWKYTPMQKLQEWISFKPYRPLEGIVRKVCNARFNVADMIVY